MLGSDTSGFTLFYQALDPFGCFRQGPQCAFDRCGRIPPIEEVFAGTAVSVPTRPEALLALVSLFAPYAKKHIAAEGIDNALAYAIQLPNEFRNRVFSDLLEIKVIRKRLQRNATFDDWFARSGKAWEDYGL